MAGIYLHIPFCKQKCHYCNFYSIASLSSKDDFLKALISEIQLQKKYLSGETTGTIYFGGGTPSLLSQDELQSIIDKLHETYDIEDEVEITLEANPDDLHSGKIKELKNTGINRLSIGIQSFFPEDLHYLNRVHSDQQAMDCIKRSQDAGFTNISIDLIYGIPGLNDEKWLQNLATFRSFNLPHLSAYGLTVEPKTPLEVMIRKNRMQDVDDNQIAGQFRILMEFAENNGMEHYEISNFCQPGQYSQHNTNYWFGKKYLGLGPSAHSFDTQSRQWNVAGVRKYCDSLYSGIVPFETETLSDEQKFNEYVMLSIRTMWGIQLDYIQKNFGSMQVDQFKKATLKLIREGYLKKENKSILLSKEGKLFADRITSDLFIS
ncbi:MAG: radical SAM family heme chaperone HemW [Bacteroidales bacterium]|nr:radical SAM family heme chaperone HemW [Bacteroidales bacterium]